MCGIGAISLSPTSQLPVRQLAHELLLHSEERGKVASGFGYAYGKQSFYVKDPKPGGHLPLKVLPKDARTVIVHTRNATFGDPEENDNNHPVVDDREEIILVHNGVITNHKAIRDGEKDVQFPEVDSAVLPWLIREFGADGLQHVDGWAAVAWLDQSTPGELNLARVKGAAPMVVVYLDDGSIVMGSTFPIIHASLINVGYGDRIVGGWEVPDLTHLRVMSGTITGIGNLTPYTQYKAKYKATAMSYQERQRLEKITNGDAVSYGKDNPVHAPKTSTPSTTGTAHTPPKPQTPTAGSLVGAGVSPGTATATGSGTPRVTSTPNYGPKKTVHVEPGADPMAAFRKAEEKLPPAPKSTYVGGGSHWDNRHTTKTILPEHPVPAYLERRLRYWVSWADDPKHTIDTDTLFIPRDLDEDKGYLFNIFMDVVADSEQRGLIFQWGVFDEKGEPRHFGNVPTQEEVVRIMISMAEKLPPRPERAAPKDEGGLGSSVDRSASDAPAVLAGLETLADDEDVYEVIGEEGDGVSLRELFRVDGSRSLRHRGGFIVDDATGRVVNLDDISVEEWNQLMWQEDIE